MFHPKIILFLLLLSALPAAARQESSTRSGTATYPGCHDTGNADRLPLCSYTTTNRSCQITIDRFNPSTPPTIYVRPGCRVHVTVTHPYKLEKLTLDWKSTDVVVPTDVVANAFSGISTSTSAAVVTIQETRFGAELGTQPMNCENQTGAPRKPFCADAVQIAQAQRRVEKEIRKADRFSAFDQKVLPEIVKALQPPPGGNDKPGWPWSNAEAWKCVVSAKIRSYYRAKGIDDVVGKMSNLDKTVAQFTNDASNIQAAEQAKILAANQSALHSEWMPFQKLKVLRDGLENLQVSSGSIAGNADITDTAPGDRNYQNEVWTLNYTNLLAPLVQRVTASKLIDEDTAAWNGMGTVPAKEAIVQITVQFQATSRWEFSTGLVVPALPYHSYTVAAEGSNGTVTNNFVQENKTWAVVPMALGSFRVHEWVRHRWAGFATGGVGVNTATTNAEFALGGGVSWRSLEFSFLGDYGRDTYLAGGFTKNEPLGTTPPSSLPTTTSWGWKPAIAISVRIPLGGGS
jgi:hypothetical protein